MVVVRDLSAPTPSAQPQAAAPTPQAVTQLVDVRSGEQLLAQVLQGQVGVIDNPSQFAGRSCLVFNASNRSQNWPQQQAEGMADGDFGLVQDGILAKAMPFKYWLMHSTGFKTKMDDGGIVLQCSTDMKRNDLDDHFVALLLVDVQGKIIPARGEFRTTKSSTVDMAAKQITQAASPEWAKKTPEHMAAAAFQIPFGRVKHEATITTKISRSGPRAGKPYKASAVVSKPATVEDMKRLTDFISNPENGPIVAATANAYQYKVNTLLAQAAMQK